MPSQHAADLAWVNGGDVVFIEAYTWMIALVRLTGHGIAVNRRDDSEVTGFQSGGYAAAAAEQVDGGRPY